VNIPSHYGQPFCYDLNMRCYEIMGCGVPLVTNALPALADIGFIDGVHGMAYKDPDHLCQIVYHLVKHPLDAMQMGQAARKLVEERHLYSHRATQVLEWLN
jgi:spore maturation protein CgeB